MTVQITDTVDQWLHRSAHRWIEDHPNEAHSLREGFTTRNDWLCRAERLFNLALHEQPPVVDVDLSQSQLF